MLRVFKRKNNQAPTIVKRRSLVSPGQILFWAEVGMTERELINQTNGQLTEYEYLNRQIKRIRSSVTPDQYDNAIASNSIRWLKEYKKTR